jgi:hypothetical protein
VPENFHKRFFPATHRPKAFAPYKVERFFGKNFTT